MFVCAAVYTARAVTTPILLGLVLAYIFNPLVTWLNRRVRCPRWASTLTLMLFGATIFCALLLVTVPQLLLEGQQLKGSSPDYVLTVTEQLGINIDWEQLRETAGELVRDQTAEGTDIPVELDYQAIAHVVMKALDIGVGIVGSTVSLATYIVVSMVVIAFCFFFFCWKFDPTVEWFEQLLPASWKDTSLDVIHKMDQSVSAFIRGRLIQSLVMGVVLCIGWKFAGVPYWLLLGMLSGLLNLVPFVAVVGWIIAAVLTGVDHMSMLDPQESFNVMVIVWPTVVYVIAQMLDGWVVEPVVQGKATDLDPLTILLAVLIGGALAGMLGGLIAIPVTTCLKILSKEVLMPYLRGYLARL